MKSPHNPLHPQALPTVSCDPTAKTAADCAAAPKDRFGQFRILRPHARGGLGQVSLAMDESLGRTVAVKEIRADIAQNAHTRRRFVQEAEVTGQLEHPNIVPIYALGQDEHGRPYYAMRFVDGQTLEQLIAAYHAAPTPLVFQDLLRRFVAVCQAMAYAHSQGIIHRDLKPANIMTGRYGETLILDWGLAKRLNGRFAQKPHDGTAAERALELPALSGGGHTLDGHAIGTPAYMPPEQAQSTGSPSGSADIYALGAILYHILTSHPPHQGESRTEVVSHAARGEVARPSSVRMTVPKALEAVCMKALAPKPEDRYASASELAQEVERFLADEPVGAYRQPFLARAARWGRRHKPLVAAAAALLITAVVALAISNVLVAQQRNGKVVALAAERQARDEANQNLQLAGSQQRLAEEERARAEFLVAQQRRTLYASRMKLAHQAWEGGDAARVLELLKLEQPRSDGGDQRGFEWHYLWRLCHSHKLRLAGNSGRIRAIAAHPDGKRVFTAADDGGIRLWSLVTGEELSAFHGHSGEVSALAVSPDGSVLASVGADKMVRLWNVSSGAQTIRFPEHDEQIAAVAFSPDGRLLATGTGHIATGGGAPPDRFFRSAAGGRVTLFESATGREVARFDDDRLGGITSLSFSRDGATLAIGAAGQGATWNVREQTLQHLFRSGSAILSVAYSPSGKSLATAGYDGSVRLWDAATGEEISTPMRHRGPVMTVAFSPDGQTLASAGTDQLVRLWDLNHRREADSIKGHTGWIAALAFVAGGHDIISGSWDGDVKVWDVQQPQDREVIGRVRSSSVTFSPDGGRLVAAIREIGSGVYGANLWDTKTGKIERRLRIGPGFFSVAVSSDNRTMALAGLDTGQLHVSDLTNGKIRLDVQAHEGWLWALAFSPDGKVLATGGSSAERDGLGEIKLWDVDTLALRSSLPTGTTERCRHLTFTPDGTALAGICHRGGSSVLKFWDLATLQESRSLELSNTIDWITFTPDGESFATGGWSAAVTVWDAGSFIKRYELKGHRDVVYHGTISPDGRTLATAGWDGVVKLWHVPTGQEMATLEATDGNVWSVAFSPDGLSLAAGTQHGDAGHVALWHASSGKPPFEQDNTIAIAPPPQQILHVLAKQSPAGVAEAVRRAGELSLQEPIPADLLALGEYLLLGGDTEHAVNRIREAINRGGSDHWYYKSLGWALLKVGRDEEARAALERALGNRDPGKDMSIADPDHWTAAYLLGRADQDAYVAQWQDHPKHKQRFACLPWFYIGQRMEAEGNTEQAISAYGQSIELGKLPNAHHVAHWSAYCLQRAMQNKEHKSGGPDASSSQ